MTLLALELNDCDLLSQTNDSNPFRSPAFSILEKPPFLFGNDAHAKAWINPQFSASQYWRKLGTDPLPQANKYARHTADIAFAHLKDIWQYHDCPQELIIAVPGSFSDTQISLLVGLVNALPAKLHAIIDNAVASCVNETLNPANLFIDIQLHQTVITQLSVADNKLTKVNTDLIPDLGLSHLHNATASYISRVLKQEHRFDPFHSATSQQQLFDQTAHWLDQLQHQSELKLEIKSPTGNLPIALRRKDIEQQLHPLILPLIEIINSKKYQHCHRYFSFRSKLLQQFCQLASGNAPTEETLLSESSCLKTLLNSLLITDEEQESAAPSYFDSLPFGEPNPNTLSVAAPNATHLLMNNTAYSLKGSLSISKNDQNLHLASGFINTADLVVTAKDSTLEVLHDTKKLSFDLPSAMTPGNIFSVNGQTLMLIEVADD